MKQKTIKIKLAVLLLIGIFFLNTQIQAQVTIGSGIAPDDNALLDLKEGDKQPSTKGLLLPRVELKALTNFYPLKAHVKGMFVYNIADVDDEVFPGCYYNIGTQWVRAGSSSFVMTEEKLNNLWTAQTGWSIKDQDFHSYGKVVNFILKLERTGAAIQSWNATNHPLIVATITNTTNKAAYKPIASSLASINGININCLAEFPARTISTTAESKIDFDGSIYIQDVRESVGTFLNRGTIQKGDLIVISGTYFIN